MSARAYARLERADGGAAGAVRARRPRRAVARTPPTWNAAPRASRSAWRASRCAAARCRSGCSRATASAGTLAFTLPEALWLAAHGAEDILVAYPTADRRRARELARDRGGRQRDGDGRQRRAARADRARDRRRAERRGWRLHRRRRRLARRSAAACASALKRSPMHTPEQAAALARAIARAPGRCGWSGSWPTRRRSPALGDDPPGGRCAPRAIRAMQARSARELAARRAAVVAAVQECSQRGRRAAARARQRRRHRQPADDRRRGGRHRADGRLGAVRADAVRRLPRLHAAPGGAVRAAGRAGARARAS